MTRRYKVLIIAPTPYFSDRGCHVRIYEEAKTLKSRGHEVVIVTYHLGRDLGEIPVVRVPKVPWYNKLSAGPSWHKPYLDILLLYKSLATAKQFHPDIIHAHLHEGAFLAEIARRSFKAPIVFDCQGSLVGELLDHGFIKQKSLLHRLFSKLEEWITCQADHIVTSSTPTADFIKTNFPVTTEKVTPLTDAVDTELFKPCAKDLALLENLGIPTEKKLLVYLGAMTKYQGVDLLMESLKILANQRDDFHALLMGYPETKYLELANMYGLSQRVTFTGMLDYSMASHYLNLGDIAVSPKLSRTEANGKLLNYMASGLPCVVFDNKVNRELLGECAVYVKSQNETSFASAIEKLLDEPEESRRLAAESRNYAEKKHSWSSRITVLEEVYNYLLLV